MNSANVVGETFALSTASVMCTGTLLSASCTNIVLELSLMGVLCSISSTRSLPSRAGLSTYAVESRGRASAAWCFNLAQCTTSKSR